MVRLLVAASLAALLALPGETRSRESEDEVAADSSGTEPAPPEEEEEAVPADSTGAPADSVSAPAAAAPDTSRRATGTVFRFGSTVAMVQRHGSFPIVRTMGRAREVARAGPGRWFGIDGTVTLFFRAGRLQRVHFKADAPSRRAIDYAQDQLRSSGFRPVCDPPNGVSLVCTWRGPITARVQSSGLGLEATLEPPASPRAPRVVDAPEVFVIGRPGAVSRLPAPRVADSPPPGYPEEAAAARVQGNVWVRAQVDTSGAVRRATVARGIPELDAAAIQNALQWRFEPYRINGAPARFEVEFPVRFVLH